MLDIHFIRENAEVVKAGAAKKHIVADIDRLLVVDDERRRLKQEIETKRAEQNRRSSEIQRAQGVEREKLLEATRQLKAGMTESEEALKGVMEEWQRLMLRPRNDQGMGAAGGGGDAEILEVKF